MEQPSRPTSTIKGVVTSATIGNFCTISDFNRDMASTPERRNSVGNAISAGLVFGSQRRYSRAYDQPIVQQTSKGPVVRVESEDNQSEASAMTSTSDGQILNPEANNLGNYVAQGCLGLFIVVGALVGLGGREFLVGASQLFGFMFLFLCSFVVCSGLYLWWGAWNKDSINLSVKKVIIVYSICTTSDLLGRLVTTYAAIPAADSLPFNTSYYIFLATLLFASFALFAHRDGLNGMFSQEACLFVGLSCVLNFTSWCLFGDIVPGLLLPQLVYTSVLMGLTLSLVSYRFPHISPSSVYWALANPSSQHRPPRHMSTIRRSTRKMSAVSDTSSSIRQKISHSSASSMFSVNPVSYSCCLLVRVYVKYCVLLLWKLLHAIRHLCGTAGVESNFLCPPPAPHPIHACSYNSCLWFLLGVHFWWCQYNIIPNTTMSSGA